MHACWEQPAQASDVACIPPTTHSHADLHAAAGQRLFRSLRRDTRSSSRGRQRARKNKKTLGSRNTMHSYAGKETTLESIEPQVTPYGQWHGCPMVPLTCRLASMGCPPWAMGERGRHTLFPGASCACAFSKETEGWHLRCWLVGGWLFYQAPL